MAAEGERVQVGGGGKRNELPSPAEGTNNRPRNDEPTNLSCLLQPFSCSDCTAGRARSDVDFEIGSVCLPACLPPPSSYDQVPSEKRGGI